MKRILILSLCFLSGCALYWSDDCLIITCGKDYDMKALTSTSHTIKAKIKAVPVPELTVETKKAHDDWEVK